MFKLSNNSKTKFAKAHKNTIGFMYGLPEGGGTCPGATTGEGGCLALKKGKIKTCYMDNLAHIYKGVKASLQYNTEILLKSNQAELVALFTTMLEGFLASKAGKEFPFFRWHYSGDVVKFEQAFAMRTVMLKYPDVKFWIYTRSFKYVEILSEAPNCAVYISIDPANSEAALECYEKNKEKTNVALAYMGNELTENLRDSYFLVCPETSGKLKNTSTQGACARCRCCIDRLDKSNRMRNVQFKIH